MLLPLASCIFKVIDGAGKFSRFLAQARDDLNGIIALGYFLLFFIAVHR
jgi:hypothetical protein